MKVVGLKAKSLKDLLVLAKRAGLARTSGMAKSQLVRKLSRRLTALSAKAHGMARRNVRKKVQEPSAGKNGKSHSANGSQRRTTRRSKSEARVRSKSLQAAQNAPSGKLDLMQAIARSRAATLRSDSNGGRANGRASRHESIDAASKPVTHDRDRVVLMVRDAYWLHAFWELTERSQARAQAALGADWYSARPALRLFDVTSHDATSSTESAIRDIPIQAGIANWYVDVANPPRSFRVDIGYLTTRGRFYTLARSNSVTTPKPGLVQTLDDSWKSLREEYERVHPLAASVEETPESSELRQVVEDRLKRPMTFGGLGQYGPGALSDHGRNGFHFEIDAELIVYGRTDPSAKVTLQNSSVALRPDGSFTMRFSLPEGRQIIPGTAQTRNGLEERTIILAVERNTKELEPMVHDGQD